MTSSEFVLSEGFKPGQMHIYAAGTSKGISSITQEADFLNRLHFVAKHTNVVVVLRGPVDAYVMFSDGQKLFFSPSKVDEQQLYVSINTYNCIIEAQNNHGATTT